MRTVLDAGPLAGADPAGSAGLPGRLLRQVLPAAVHQATALVEQVRPGSTSARRHFPLGAPASLRRPHAAPWSARSPSRGTTSGSRAPCPLGPHLLPDRRQDELYICLGPEMYPDMEPAAERCTRASAARHARRAGSGSARTPPRRRDGSRPGATGTRKAGPSNPNLPMSTSSTTLDGDRS